MFCPQCGTPTTLGGKFCGQCGTLAPSRPDPASTAVPGAAAAPHSVAGAAIEIQFTMLAGDRFAVSIKGTGVDYDDLAATLKQFGANRRPKLAAR